ncbi:MAG: hypothetical protein LIO85_07275 [Rikenellaceae bacterium]|nr:hypothetical protein [Rikenellaceae bacterium]
MNFLFRIAIYAALAGLLACSSDNEPEYDNQPGQNFDRYGVATWDNPEDFLVRRYYTLVDTFTVKQPVVSVVIKATSNVYTSVQWTIDNMNYESRNVDESSNSSDLIIKTYFPLIDPGFVYEDGMRVEAYITVDNNLVERRETITEEKFYSDLFGVDFGMDSLSVRDRLEAIHGVSRFSMRDETTGVDLVTPHFISGRNGRTLYLFEGEEYGLSEVAEFPGYIWEVPDDATDGEEFALSTVFTELCRRLGCEQEIVVNRDGTLETQYEWEREGITYRVLMRDDVFPVGDESDGDTFGIRAQQVSGITRDGGSENGDSEGEDEDGEEEEDDDDGIVYLPNSIGISYGKTPTSEGR